LGPIFFSAVMKFSIQELRRCLDVAAEFSRRYAAYVAPDTSARKSRDDLLSVAQEYAGKEIGVFLLDEPLEHETIYGYYVAEANGFSILLRTGLPEDLIRFVLCKELLHVILDDKPESRTIDVSVHLEQVSIAFSVADSDPSPAVKSELLAEVAAMEFFFPYKARVEELKANPPDYQKIAEKYCIPQYLVEIYLHPTFMSELGAMEKP
jgi:Zn-dependent peptidase ImmA (M78 family)